MPVPLPIMKYQCKQCSTIKIVKHQSDFIVGQPICKKCNHPMKSVGQASLIDLITSPFSILK